MSFTVKSRGCAALSQPATRPSRRTWASLGCEAITRHSRAHAAALGAQRQMESSPLRHVPCFRGLPLCSQRGGDPAASSSSCCSHCCWPWVGSSAPSVLCCCRFYPGPAAPVLVLPRRRDDSKCFAPEGVSFPTVNQAALSQHNVTERSAPAKSHMPGCGVSSLASFKWVLLSCKECNYVRLAVFRAVSQQTEHKYRRACRAA